MRRVLLIAFGILAATLVGVGARAQSDAKIGFVNSERIFREYAGVTEAQRAYQIEYDTWWRELQNRERELVSKEQDFRSQEPMLSEERRREKESELQRLSQEFEQYRQSIFGEEGKAQKRNQELMEPILAAVNAAVEKVAIDGEYDIIFDGADGNIVYGHSRFDITDLILDELRAQSQEPGTTPLPPTEPVEQPPPGSDEDSN